MTPTEAAKAITKVLDNGDWSKADKARALYDLGLTKTEVSEVVPMNYSQAHSVWKAWSNGAGSGTRVGSEVHQPSGATTVATPRTRAAAARRLNLTPTQARVATQDGHRVIKVDKDGGATCVTCDGRLQYSIRWLAFVHAGSTADPTDLEDTYYEPDPEGD